jgi:sodium transport system permease protein
MCSSAISFLQPVRRWTMFKDSLLILNKELKRMFTDRRSLMFLIVLPLVMLPAMYSVMAKMDQAKDTDIASFTSTICLYEGEGNDGVIEPFIEAISSLNTSLELVSYDELETAKQAITDKEKELLIVLPDNIEESLNGFSVFDIAIFLNSTADYSQYTYRRVNEVLAELEDSIVHERVVSSGLSEEMLTVYTVNETAMQYDLAREGSVVGKVIAILLPFFIIIYLFVNSMKVGLDSVAGEKERGTLAILLVNQVDRLSIVIGKMLSVMVAAIVGAASSMIGLIISSRYFVSMFGATGPGMSGYSLSTISIVQFAIVTVPLAILVASIVLIVSTYARNSKEGQGMIMPIYFVVMIAGMASMQSGDVPPRWMQSTPVFNSLIALKQIFMQDATWSSILTACISSILLASVLIYLTLRMFTSEKILFRI